MAEKRVKVPFPTPISPPMDGSEVGVSESTEKWSEVTLEDGTILRVKPSVLSAVRVDGQYDPDGNPAYLIKAQQVVMVASSPEHLRKPAKDAKVQ
jgi:hypothetical protein